MRQLLASILLIAILGLPLVTLAEETPAASPVVPVLAAQDIEAFFDGMIPNRLRSEDIAGLTISVVKDGQIIFAKGYGYADVAAKKPVSPSDSLFRPGSVSKLITWTAVMQLVEQGKLDLNKDVNSYIDFTIPEAFGEPITLTHILTHTAGFEEAIKDLIASGDRKTDLGGYLKSHIPGRIYPPGKVPAYSNYGTALAGYIVERVSGKSFDEYSDEFIFKPLGMNNSSLRQPLPQNLVDKMSKGYTLASGEPKPFEVIDAYPAGSLSSSATDMANFMIAHLQNGKFGETQILKEDTAKLMHSRLYSMDPEMNGMAHGFYEQSVNGLRIIGHGGDTQLFHSNLHLILDKGVGLFLSYNSTGRNQSNLRDIVFESFMDRYFPAPASDALSAEGAKADVDAVVGSYLPSRRPETSIFRTISLLGQAQVSATEKGNIIVSMLNGSNGKPIEWQPIGNMTFREVGGTSTIVFRPDHSGALRLVMRYPFMTFTRVGKLESPTAVQVLAGFALGVMLLTLIFWPIGWYLRRHYDRPLALEPEARRRRLLVRIVFALNLAFIVGLGALVTSAFSSIDKLNDGLLPWLWTVQGVGVIATLGNLIVLYNGFKAWTDTKTGIWGKIQATLFVLASISLIWVVYLGNMLVFKSNF